MFIASLWYTFMLSLFTNEKLDQVLQLVWKIARILTVAELFLTIIPFCPNPIAWWD